MLRPRWQLTLVGRPSVSSQSVRASSEGLGLLETPKHAKTQAMGQHRKILSCLRGPRTMGWPRLPTASWSLSLFLQKDAVTEDQYEEEEEDGHIQQDRQHADHS